MLHIETSNYIACLLAECILKLKNENTAEASTTALQKRKEMVQ